MARKAVKQFQYDSIIRGTNDFIPVTFMRQVSVDPSTGEPLDEPTMVPFDLTGRVAVLTVKQKEWDGSNPASRLNGKPAHDEPLLMAWKKELMDRSTPETDFDRSINPAPGPWGEDYLFRIFIDCDDPSEGAAGPQGDNRYDWQNNYQGMYNINKDTPMDPTLGQVIFRLTKKMTMIKPGTYSFDIRLMEKMKKQIGMIRECRNWAPIFGMLDIQGTPTNRTVVYDWEDLTNERSS